MVGFDGIGRVAKEPAQHLPQTRRSDAAGLIEVTDYGGIFHL